MTRIEWIIGALMGLMIFLALILGLLLIVWQGTNDAQDSYRLGKAPASVFAGSTFLNSYELALIKAQQWQPDATLLKANATWPQGASREEIISGTSLWSFSFYSPADVSVGNISVVEDQVTLVNQHSVNQPLNPLQTENCRVDSNVAVLRMLDEGGESFLHNNDISTLTMVLTSDQESGRIEWLMSMFGVQTNQSFVVRLDATTGEALESTLPS